jgi:trigger factor
VESVVIESNVAEYVMSKAKVTEKSVSFDELMGQQG